MGLKYLVVQSCGLLYQTRTACTGDRAKPAILLERLIVPSLNADSDALE